MKRRALMLVGPAVMFVAATAAQEGVPGPAALSSAIDRLGSLDSHEIRMESARTVRRAPVEAAVPALTRAVREHDNEYVRFRALVLLAGFGQPGTSRLMRELIADHNDRIRTVVFAWFEHHPEPDVIPRLLEVLETERSEFVRPALTRALAASGEDLRVREALVPLVHRGEDLFRGAVIEALGHYRRIYALSDIVSVARLEGPLQDDAISAIGRMGDPSGRAALAELQRTVPRELQPTISASLCLLEVNCDTHKAFILESLRFAAGGDSQQPQLRGAVHALGLLALGGHDDALAALFAAGVPAPEPVRAPVALAAGLVALRDPALALRTLARSPERDGAILLLRDAFDMLSEDFEEERFYVTVRRAYWAAADESPERELTQALIRVLEF